MKLNDKDHNTLAQRLVKASQSGQGMTPPSETLDFDLEDSWHIRRKFVDILIGQGATPIGHKIGFTSEAMREMYGMAAPDFGILLDNMVVPADTPIPISGRCDTRAEPEIAFVLAKDLTGPRVTRADVMAATDYVCAAIEVIDSRVGALRAKANDSLADNAGAGFVILGDVKLPPSALDLSSLQMTMTHQGTDQCAPAGDVMGHPAEPLAWLANKLTALDGLGGTLRAGDVIITGTPLKSVPVAAGEVLSADFGPLGQLDLGFC